MRTHDVLPCGCKVWTDDIGGVPTMMYEPHAMDCTYYLYFLEESKKQDKPPTVLDMR